MSEKFELAEAFLLNSPEEAANAIERLPPADAAAFLETREPGIVAAVIAKMAGPAAVNLLAGMKRASAVTVLKQMPVNDIARLFRSADAEMRSDWEAALPNRVAGRVRGFLSYGADQVGAWTEANLLELRSDQKILQARETVHSAKGAVDDPQFIVGPGRRYAGAVWLIDLLRGQDDRRLETLAKHEPAPVYDRSPIHSVAASEIWWRFGRVPVIDRTDRLVGALRFNVVKRAVGDAGETLHESHGAGAASALLQVGSLYFGSMSNTFQLLLAPRGVRFDDDDSQNKGN